MESEQTWYRLYSKLFLGIFLLAFLAHTFLHFKETYYRIERSQIQLRGYLRGLEKTLSSEYLPSATLYILAIFTDAFPAVTCILSLIFLIGCLISSWANASRVTNKRFKSQIFGRSLIAGSTFLMFIMWLVTLRDYS